ncbi:MAG: hypothetical protein ACXABY_34730 [Candidatus Thorarchaeota archaeon]
MFDVCIFQIHNPEWQNQWDYVLRNFQPDNIYVVGNELPATKPFLNAILIDSIEDLPKDKSLVLLSPKNARFYGGKKDLIYFDHPENTVYIFGADDANLTPDMFKKRKPDYRVFIETDTDDEMYSFVSAAIVFYHRRLYNG